MSADLLAWYEPRRRAFPWRRARPRPYHVLVSEVMLQQTQAARVARAFDAFIDRFGSIDELASAPTDEVIRYWGGLGYNRRAVALSAAAASIVEDHGGTVPRDPAVLASLPGIGPYTAAAIASIAYRVPVPAIDVNVGRVLARVWLGADPHDVGRSVLARIGARAVDAGRPGDWNQALMDLGREHCRSQPRCGGCPLAARCRFSRTGARASRPPVARPRFEGSDRQVRGAIVRALRYRGSATIRGLVQETGHERDRVVRAVRSLAADGLVRAGPQARSGRDGGRVQLGP